MTVLSWLKRKHIIKCDHTQNYIGVKYLSPNGTPMVSRSCGDCGHADNGHVYGDSEGWCGMFIIENGKCVLDDPTETM